MTRGRSACMTATRASPPGPGPGPARVGRARRASRGRRPRPGRVRSAQTSTSGALVTTTVRVARARVRRPVRPSRVRARRVRRRRARTARRALACTNDRSGITTAVARASLSTGRFAMGCVCYRAVDLVYPVAKGIFWPWLRYGLRWTIEGIENVPETGAVILASNHISYLDPLTLAFVGGAARPAVPLPRQGRAVRQAGTRPVAARRRPDPGAARQGRCRRRTGCGGGCVAARRVRHGVSRRHDLARPRTDAREVGNGAARAAGRTWPSCRSGCGARTA